MTSKQSQYHITYDDLMPSGTVYLDGQTLEVLEINC